jgi:NTE family protein
MRKNKNLQGKTVNLCFEGGGIRGLCYVGVAKALEKHLVTSKRLIGSSAGSIFAGLLAVNASSSFLEQEVMNTDFNNFMDGWGWKLGISYRLWYKMGMYNGDYFVDWYGALLKKLTGNADITIGDIYTVYNKELIITTTDLNNKKTVYLSYKNEPDMPVRKAVRMSMSLPYVYVPIHYKCVYYIDGGYLNNYPIDYLDTNYPNEESIGFRLMGGEGVIDCHNLNLNILTLNLLESAIERIEYLETREDDIDRTVEIDTGNLVCTDFNIDNKTKIVLIKNGFDATDSFLSG